MSTTATVTKYPPCDFHKALKKTTVDARYDGKTLEGEWAFMCSACFGRYGVGLGLGRGQLLVLREENKTA